MKIMLKRKKIMKKQMRMKMNFLKVEKFPMKIRMKKKKTKMQTMKKMSYLMMTINM